MRYGWIGVLLLLIVGVGFALAFSGGTAAECPDTTLAVEAEIPAPIEPPVNADVQSVDVEEARSDTSDYLPATGQSAIDFDAEGAIDPIGRHEPRDTEAEGAAGVYACLTHEPSAIAMNGPVTCHEATSDEQASGAAGVHLRPSRANDDLATSTRSGRFTGAAA